MASIVIGLPWGAVGVAASFAFTRVLIVDPLLYWFVGRSGPVRTIDFYKTMAPFVAASLWSVSSESGTPSVVDVNSARQQYLPAAVTLAVSPLEDMTHGLAVD